MFEFDYSIDLMITHPSLDAGVITRQLRELRPQIAVTAGDEKMSTKGTPLGRKVQQSVWSARLHDEGRLDSSAQPLAEFLRSRLAMLEHKKDFFRETNEQGDVFLNVGWFSHGSHSAAYIESDVIARCAELGLGLELNLYITAQTDTAA